MCEFEIMGREQESGEWGLFMLVWAGQGRVL